MKVKVILAIVWISLWVGIQVADGAESRFIRSAGTNHIGPDVTLTISSDTSGALHYSFARMRHRKHHRKPVIVRASHGLLTQPFLFYWDDTSRILWQAEKRAITAHTPKGMSVYDNDSRTLTLTPEAFRMEVQRTFKSRYMTHKSATAHYLHVGNLILVLSVFIAFGVVSVVGFSALTRRFIAWKLLVRKFPATDFHKSGMKYSLLFGFYYRFHNHKRDECSLNYMFSVEVAQEGLLITGYFAMRSPILVPWPDVQVLEGSGMLSRTRVRMLYDDDRQLDIYIPGLA